MIAELERIVGGEGVIASAADMAAYTAGCRGRFKGDALCVVRPANTDETAAVIATCAAARVAILPQGGNTSLCGGSVPRAGGGVIVNLGRMCRIRGIDAANNTLVAEAGCVLADVQRAALDAGRFYPVSLGAEGSCQIGGTIATNAGGTGVLRYGGTRDNVLGLEVVLPDGRVWNGLRGLRKDNTGFDLKQLFIGSEGALGVITAAVLRLHPLASRHLTAWLAPVSLEAAVEVLARVQAALGAQLSAFEIMNSLQVRNVIAHLPGRKSPLDPGRPWHVIAELATSADVNAELERVVERAIADGVLGDAALARSEAQRMAMWAVRHGVVEANDRAGHRIVHDIAVPLSKIPEFVRQADAALAGRFARVKSVIVGHVGDGNLHYSPMFDFADWRAMRDPEGAAAAVRRIVHDIAMALGGSFSAEHGIGGEMLAEMRRYKSPVELDLMRAIKRALDPHGLFNPGRVVPDAA